MKELRHLHLLLGLLAWLQTIITIIRTGTIITIGTDLNSNRKNQAHLLHCLCKDWRKNCTQECMKAVLKYASPSPDPGVNKHSDIFYLLPLLYIPPYGGGGGRKGKGGHCIPSLIEVPERILLFHGKLNTTEFLTHQYRTCTSQAFR
jgi:hypothetical protein